MKKTLITLFFTAAALMAVAQENYKFDTGMTSLTLLSEGQGQGNKSILIGATPEMLAATAPDGTFPNAINAFLYKTPNKTILIDAGLGRKLFENLAAEGVTPEQVDIVLLTHTHGDHIGGLLRDGKVAFPNAELCISRAEFEWVLNGSNAAAKAVIEAYSKQVKVFDPNGIEHGFIQRRITREVFAIAAPGHTPGHTVYVLSLYNSSSRKHVLVWGDATHAMAVQMPYPQISVTYDSDPVQAAKSRAEIFEYCGRGTMPVAGMHIPYPGMGTVTKAGEGYVFTPME
ncbi:MAG: MBL fold metallo-hydrolase [Rikenellaceae bacterium]|jgi:glyoxylase-like metal-dependent hydrolase (beta-lactamase superfamily II)|nr:MBL fold metallo-hydrolase [Rikenellaceae bacterium]